MTSQPIRSCTLGDEGTVEKETTKDVKATPPATPLPATAGQRANGKASGVRTASKEQFKKAHAKTSAQHAGLFRRLAK